MLEDGAVTVGKAIGWSDIANGAVKANLVVVVNKGFGNALCVLEGQGCFWPDSLLLESVVKSFDFAVTLREVRRGEYTRGLKVANEGFEVLGYKLKRRCR